MLVPLVAMVLMGVMLWAFVLELYKLLGRPFAERLGRSEVPSVDVAGKQVRICTGGGVTLTVDLESVKGVSYYRSTKADTLSRDFREMLFYDARGQATRVPGYHALVQPVGDTSCEIAVDTTATVAEVRAACPWWTPITIKGYGAYRWVHALLVAVAVLMTLSAAETVSRDLHFRQAEKERVVADLYTGLIIACCAAALPVLLPYAWRAIVRRQIRRAQVGQSDPPA